MPHVRGLTAWTVGMLLCGFAGAAPADEGAVEEGWLGRLTSRDTWTIHGFFTQAYAATDGSTFFGIPEEGTGNYQTMALQVSFLPSPRDTFVVQLDRETLGESRLGELRGQVEVDWAFYARDLNDSLTLRAGRMPLPLGIFNEIRDVGTLLPFYRPPVALYLDGLFIAERIDGLQLGYRQDLGEWRMESFLYGGAWEVAEAPLYRGTGQPVRKKAQDVLGTQLWLGTPIDGLRLGMSYYQYSAELEDLAAEGEDRRQAWRLSADGDFGAWLLRGEYAAAQGRTGKGSGWYVQAGYRPTRRLGIYAEIQRAALETRYRVGGSVERWPFHEEESLSINVYLRPNWVVKAEYHWATTTLVEEYETAEDWPVDVGVGIVSLSFSF